MGTTIGAVVLADCGLCSLGTDSGFFCQSPRCKARLASLRTLLTDYSEVILAIPNEMNRSFSACKELFEAFQRSRSDWLLSVPCGMFFFTKDVADYLIGYLSSDYDAIIPMDRHGHTHPSFGLYSRQAATSLEALILNQTDDLHELSGKIKTKYVSLQHTIFPDQLLSIVTSFKQYATLSKEILGPPVVAVSGVKNSGKTTLLKGVIPILVSHGLKVAVIKHDGHDFIPDMPGTDSFILREAGAEVVVVYSSNRYLVNISRSDFSLGDVKQNLGAADLVLYEGGKYTKYPKIEIVRRANSDKLVGDVSTMIAICTDADLDAPGIPTIGINDYPSIARVLVDYLNNGAYQIQFATKGNIQGGHLA